jgi:hypothetical protein
MAKGKNNTKAEQAREKQTTAALKKAKVPAATIKAVLSQATRTGKGLSVNEAKFLQNQAKILAGSKVKTQKQAQVFLGTLDQRKEFNKLIEDKSKPAPPPPPPAYDPSSDVPPAPGLVRVPERDVVSLASQDLDAETITNLLFENIGAVELTKFVRHDTVEGINAYYDIISNLSEIKRRFDPSELISIQKPESSNFDIYSIKLQDKLPDDEYLSRNNILDYVYFDTNNGDLIIEVVNLSESEIVEVQIDSGGTIYRIEEL